MTKSHSSAKDSSLHNFSNSRGGHSKSLSILDISKAYKFITSKLYLSDHKSPHSSKYQANQEKLNTNNNSAKDSTGKKNTERITRSNDATTSSGAESSPPHGSPNESFFLLRRPSFLYNNTSKHSDTAATSSLSRSTSQRSKTPIFSSFTRSSSRSHTRSQSSTRRSSSIMELDFQSFGFDGPLLSRNMSQRVGSEPTTPIKMSRSMSSNKGSTPIVFSQSAARRRPQPVEMKLECTLEELLFGCVKEVVIVRDVISEIGIVEKEEETLRINVKPGWRKGTTITFEGKGDEKPGYLRADIVFSVDEIRHPLFKKKGDDLEIAVEIPLVQALTGGMLWVPLLGGEKMSLLIEEVVYPGYEKVITNQGMPYFQEEEEKRGDLRITFFVLFPKELSKYQRDEICSILEDYSP